VETVHLAEPADQPQRDLILHDLRTSMLVEAAAGTGKTTSMVGRMVNLLAQGECLVDTLAAVTFTRKAAGELRSRFQLALERACGDPDPVRRDRVTRALSSVDRCFIGTIHSFCGRLLRERPVEAGVDVAFQELEERQDALLRQQAWEDYVAQCYADDDPIVSELEALGVDIGSLADSFLKFADYPDVQDWPAVPVELPDLEPARAALERMVGRMQALAEHLPENAGNDKLIPKYRRIPLMWRQARPHHVLDLMDILAEFKRPEIVQKNWPGGKTQALEEQAHWEDFRTEFAEPLVRLWLEKRYEPVMRALKPALERYDSNRQQRAVLNYQDLLMAAAGLLRDKPGIREYFRKRFTHLLVDEFQDTDPIQAEVMMLLTADRPEEQDWRRCRPIPGSLFVVGDPKQSIYRFRRADIVTYNQVKSIIQESDGKVLNLAVNFRTIRPLVEWINGVFQARFPAESSDYSPQYVRLIPMIDDGADGAPSAVSRIDVPPDYKRNADVTEYEADFIARTIRHLIDSRALVPRSDKDRRAGIEPAARPADFMIVTPKKKNLGLYGRKLEELGIPHQVTGGGALNEVEELWVMRTCLAAVLRPADPIALVAALRGGLFGMSDVVLLNFKRKGGNFSYLSDVPEDLDADAAQAFHDAFRRLRRYAVWFATLPPMPAFERMVADVGLLAAAASGPGGNVQAGSLSKALAVLRASGPGLWTPSQLLDRISDLVERGEDFDGIGAAAGDAEAVRLMNVHKVKGLEAPVVFLADPTGDRQPSTDIFVDRAGDRIRGFLKIATGSATRWGAKEIALPRDWARYEETEARFQEAERLRLFYVAATRAASQLVITTRQKNAHHNWWRFFDKTLTDAPCLKLPDRVQSGAASSVEVRNEDVDAALAAIGNRWVEALKPSYRTAAAKTVSLSETRNLGSGGEHGTEWGTLIHLLLEAAMLDPDTDLHRLAEDSLAELGLEPCRKDDAVDTARSVMESEIWQRARASAQVLAEVPFEMLAPWNSGDEDHVPLLLRGVVDLAFREPQGWVIVDYKTDRRSVEHLAELLERYRQQVKTYVEAWVALTGDPVHEAGLYFVHARRYMVIDCRRGGADQAN
jgi:ATP-dependent helicase/nuclease subunit A